MGFTELIGLRQNMISDKGGGGVTQFLIFSDKGGGGVSQFLIFGWQGGKGGVWTSPFLADIICEPPLTAWTLMKPHIPCGVDKTNLFVSTLFVYSIPYPSEKGQVKQSKLY